MVNVLAMKRNTDEWNLSLKEKYPIVTDVKRKGQFPDDH